LKVHGVSIDGRDLETGERLTAYYTCRGERANWRPDMSPRVAAALGVAKVRADPRDDELDALFEARRADNGADWSEHVRKNSGFDFVFAPPQIRVARSRIRADRSRAAADPQRHPCRKRRCAPLRLTRPRRREEGACGRERRRARRDRLGDLRS